MRASCINKRQNEDIILRYLFCMRTLYTKAKHWQYITLVGGIVIYLIGVIPKIGDILGYGGIVIICLWPTISYVLQSIYEGERKQAANYQEYIDRYVYGLDINELVINQLNQLSSDAYEICSRKCEKFTRDTQIGGSLYDWYLDVSELPYEVDILACQYQVAYWETLQRKECKYILWGLLIIGTSLFGGIIYKMNGNIDKCIYMLPIILEIIKLIDDNYSALKTLKDMQIQINEAYNALQVKTGEKSILNTLCIIQKNIYEYRAEHISIPDWFYFFRRNAYGKSSKAAVGMFKEELRKIL